MPKKIVAVFSLLLLGVVSYSQNVQLSGAIQDSLGQPIPHTNLIATPTTGSNDISFAIADFDGKYNLKVEKNTAYAVELTSIGYASLTDTIQINQDTSKDFVLTESTEELEEVVIEAKMAMVVNEDTITYRTDNFKTGEERKLREILKKLPGVEVERDGSVTINGKKVNKLMVDGQDFFGGDTKLGVNNIPADAVEEVEAIDNYNEVSFMKGLSDSDKMAMNIKLKKDKKDFMFGENEVGGGIKNRYFIHPRLFYYSPNTTLNFIGSLNNINESPLDFQDITRFKGGDSSLFDNLIDSGDDGLMRFSNRSDIRHKKIQFGALNIGQKISKNTRLEAYSIIAKQEEQSETQTHTEYLTDDHLLEDRTTANTDRGFSNFNKIRLRSTPGNSKDLAYDILANITNNQYQNAIRSAVSDQENFTDTRQDPHDLEINQYFRYNTQPSYTHTSEIKAEYRFKKQNKFSDWDFDQPIFSDLIPIIEDEDSDRYNILQNHTSTTHTANASFKHYWVLAPTHHLYPIGGMYFFNQDYKTHDYQQLTSGAVNDFDNAGFGNDINYLLLNPYVGLQYKFMIGDVVIRPGLMYEHYFWRVNQFSEKISDQQKGTLLPEFKLEYKMNTNRRLEFNYKRKSSFADAEKYANRLSLKSFNSLYQGNEDLENSLYHNLHLLYRDFNLRTGITYNIMLDYNRRNKSIRNTTHLEGIDQINTTFYNHFPENNFMANFSFNKRWEHISTRLTVGGSLSDYSRIVNDEKLTYDNQGLNYQLMGRSTFKNLPNLQLGFAHSVRRTKSADYNNKFTSLRPYAHLSYAFFSGFVLKADYQYSYSKDHSSGRDQNFQIAGVSLFYQKEDSPWGFEIKVNNLFDVDYQRNYQVDQFMIYDSRIYVQPRTALFIVSYQL